MIVKLSAGDAQDISSWRKVIDLIPLKLPSRLYLLLSTINYFTINCIQEDIQCFSYQFFVKQDV